MNNTFNMQRFLWLFNKHTKEHYKTYLMSLIVLVGFLSAALGYIASFGILKTNLQAMLFTSFLILSGTVFASQAFSDLGKKKKAISMLTLPVSDLERFLVSWIYSFIIFQLVFITCFYAVDVIIVNISNRNSINQNEVIDITSGDTKLYYFVFCVFWALHAIAFLGAVFFEKLHFIKTAIVFFVSLFILVLINKVLIYFIIGVDVIAGAPFSTLIFNASGKTCYLNESSGQPVMMITVLAITTLCIWTAAYFKLKEKQV